MKIFLLILFIPLAGLSQKSRKIKPDKFHSSSINLDISDGVDFFGLRHDVIRQTYWADVSDSTTKLESVPYHEMGFDLGNFLFFDLNNNLGVRIDRMMKLDLDSNFTIVSERPRFLKNQIVFYQFSDGEFSIKNGKKKRYKMLFQLDKTNESFDVYGKRRYQYSIIQDEEGIFKKTKRRYAEEIYLHGNQNYSTHHKPGRGDIYELKNGKIELNKTYTLATNPEKNAIEIYSWKPKKLRNPIYSIRYNEKEIIIYDKKRIGYYIRYSPTTVQVFYKGKEQIRYKRIN